MPRVLPVLVFACLTAALVSTAQARVLGLEKRVGSIERGKDADLALYDGDPFEYTSHCLGTVIDGVHHAQDPR